MSFKKSLVCCFLFFTVYACNENKMDILSISIFDTGDIFNGPYPGLEILQGDKKENFDCTNDSLGKCLKVFLEPVEFDKISKMVSNSINQKVLLVEREYCGLHEVKFKINMNAGSRVFYYNKCRDNQLKLIILMSEIICKNAGTVQCQYVKWFIDRLGKSTDSAKYYLSK